MTATSLMGRIRHYHCNKPHTSPHRLTSDRAHLIETEPVHPAGHPEGSRAQDVGDNAQLTEGEGPRTHVGQVVCRAHYHHKAT